MHETEKVTANVQDNVKIKEDTLYQRKVKENFHIYGLAAFLYACLYAFCMYDNGASITYPLFVAGTAALIGYFVRRLEITWRRDCLFHVIGMILLSISTFCTDDNRIVFMNKLGIFFLTLSMLLGLVYDTGKWSPGKYVSAMWNTCVSAVGAVGAPFADCSWYCKNKLDKKNSKYLYVVLGLVGAVPLAVIVLCLLSSADAVFRNMVEELIRDLDFTDCLEVLWMICLMFLVSYCLLVSLCRKTVKEVCPDSRKGEPLAAIPVAAVLTFVYLVFSVVQIRYLFVGGMQLPEGYTYAEYAREGFFQLLAVGLLNLVLVIAGLCCFKPNRVLKGILFLMSVCTYVMLASSGMRMIIYIQYYYLTFQRILVLWALAVLGILFVGVLLYIRKESFPLFRYSVVVVTCLYIALSFSHPDYWIARVNVGSMQENRSEFFRGNVYSDYHYLATLNADAAPVMLELLEEENCDWDYYYATEEQRNGYQFEVGQGRGFCYTWLERMRYRTKDMSLRKFNVSRFLMDLEILERSTAGM